MTIAPSATPINRASIGISICSDVYLSRKATPKNNTITPKRTKVLPPKKKFHSAEGSVGVRGAVVRGSAGRDAKVGPPESDGGGCIGGLWGDESGATGVSKDGSVCEAVSAGPAGAGS